MPPRKPYSFRTMGKHDQVNYDTPNRKPPMELPAVSALGTLGILPGDHRHKFTFASL